MKEDEKLPLKNVKKKLPTEIINLCTNNTKTKNELKTNQKYLFLKN